MRRWRRAILQVTQKSDPHVEASSRFRAPLPDELSARRSYAAHRHYVDTRADPGTTSTGCSKPLVAERTGAVARTRRSRWRPPNPEFYGGVTLGVASVRIRVTIGVRTYPGRLVMPRLITESEARVARLAVQLVTLAETVGVVPRSTGSGVDRDQVDAALSAFARVGVARSGSALRNTATPDDLSRLLAEVLSAIEESPLPQYEWPSLSEVFGDDLLAKLVGVSLSSVHRYRSGERTTPDETASRLHHLALITADLAGSYNDIGIRRWFQRPRAALRGVSPSDVLSVDWSSDDASVQEVRALAASLLASSAT